MSEKKEYIGDGAYAEVLSYGSVRITAEDGRYVIDRVYIEESDLPKLLMFLFVHYPQAFTFLKGQI